MKNYKILFYLGVVILLPTSLYSAAKNDNSKYVILIGLLGTILIVIGFKKGKMNA